MFKNVLMIIRFYFKSIKMHIKFYTLVILILSSKIFKHSRKYYLIKMFISLYAISRELSNSFVNIVPMVTLILFSKILKHSTKCYLMLTFILQYAFSRELSASFLNAILFAVYKQAKIGKQNIPIS